MSDVVPFPRPVGRNELDFAGKDLDSYVCSNCLSVRVFGKEPPPENVGCGVCGESAWKKED